ncbi:putative 6-phosphogluconolactonase [Cupriavidus taiwanensis]|uniref:6-phosphogluconolactonase n=1 Tax=Cupriavidus taiwanensis TaxID=164546 RepID=A0A375HFH0_9BURK|nr:beta-propeller fold lactonase family protein [Cupriavidus taiwanensis]SOZ73117.1 putative 6-phosphogluconolactonase [Cupriavidus taiwanensis]SOZ73728.1 putative 6-phosphogluconolactonase [Cupriavidus taiwanensis]SOZ75267.1 putative 6-phosphogluconolactonase [Cupriavidus taiwanensis]SPA03750.1 putative 6-phosphogluconolactonase [Cupriavidus taiwanensis]SPA12572.1 putative 6-phosphogluconolactonase [Cupriavidus taiwanensis]
MATTQTFVLAAVAAQLHVLSLQGADADARQRSTVDVGLPVQFAVSHPFLPLLYIVCSNGGPGGRAGDTHFVKVLRMNAMGGTTLAQVEIPLPHRPIHVAVDPSARFLAITFARPATVRVFELNNDGYIGFRLDTVTRPDIGVFPHSVHFGKGGNTAVVCARGNDLRPGFEEDIGQLQTYSVEGGKFKRIQETAYSPGLGPRDVAEHPTRPWLYVALERGNAIALHSFETGVPSEATLNRWSVLQLPPARRQRVGNVLVHPSGRWLYAANRADALVSQGDSRRLTEGENELVVYEISTDDGSLTERHRLDAGGIEPRTLSLCENGNYLIVGNQLSAYRDCAGKLTNTPASLRIMEIHSDGCPSPYWNLDFPGQELIWSGSITVN